MARKSNGGSSSDLEVLILSSLAAGSKHGYAIMQDVKVFACIELGPGTLYSAIPRLADNNWIRPDAELAHKGRIK